MFSVDFFRDRAKWETIADEIVFTGRIDKYFNYECGKLEYNLVLIILGMRVYDATKNDIK